MMNRRGFVGTAASAAALAAATRTLAAASDHRRIYKVVVDERFAAAAAFAGEARRAGATIHPIRGDVTELWFEDLYHRWRREPAAVAGLTTGVSLYCLSEVARDAGLKVVYHAEHETAGDGRTTHQAFGSERMRAQAARLGGGDWAAEAARIVLSCPRTDFRRTPVERISALLRAGEHPDRLSSWVIAPRDA